MDDTGATGIPDSLVTVEVSAAQRRAEVVRFYEQHWRWVLRVLTVYGLRKQEAEDALQEALLKAWMRPEKPIESLPQWVVTVSLREAGKARAKTRGVEVLTDDLTEIGGTWDQDPGQYAWELREAALNDAKMLPPDQRKAVELKINGWDRREIAERLGKTTKQVSDLLCRAAHTLRKARQAGEALEGAPQPDAAVPRQRGRVSTGAPVSDNAIGGHAR